MASILWDIVVQPLVYLIEVVFTVGMRLTGSAGAAIVGVSLAVNLLCLPLYKMADDAQERLRAKQASMQRWVDHIREHFSGDERYMMLSYYYKEQGYHPLHALAGSLSLLLQIPFFMAAYSFLSNLALLRGASFAFLPDLGAPDALLTLGSLSVNVMPVAMTALNCASTVVYTRGLPLRDKAQAYGLALVFLVLLYDSPSGLVFYWTCNQLFSLGKNVFMKLLPYAGRWAWALAGAAGLAAFAWLWRSDLLATRKALLCTLALVAALEGVVVLRLAGGKVPRPALLASAPAREPLPALSFALGAALLAVLVGLWIPSALIADSPAEFTNALDGVNPLLSIRHTLCVWGGVCLLWLGTYYLLSGSEARDRYVCFLWCATAVCLADYLLFGEGLGTISNTLVLDVVPAPTRDRQLLNLLVLVDVVALAYAVFRWAPRVVTPAFGLLLAATLAVSVSNLVPITREVERQQGEAAERRAEFLEADGSPRQLLHLSRTERNVVVLFLDRAISGYVPYVFQERPELEAQFDGFTYYPNTVSFGCFTNYGTPPLYGGYEYTPANMNARSDELLQDKHDEAMLVLPTLFSEAGWQTTVFDPPYTGGYQWVPNLSIYDDLDNTEAYYNDGAYLPLLRERYGIGAPASIDRSLFFYGLFKVMPTGLQRRLYDEGNYLAAENDAPPTNAVLSQYAVLDLLGELTDTSSERPGFVLLANTTTHEPDYLQLPDYAPAAVVNNAGLEDMGRFALPDGRSMQVDATELGLVHYHANAAALIKLGQWFDWMREQGVYDNTRIIIVSDHGRDLRQFPGWTIDDMLDIEYVNPLFMVKDFHAHGFTTSDEFMTNADTPTLALAGVLDGATNPFTGVPITNADKYAHPQVITSSRFWNTTENNGYVFDTSDAPWYSVHDDIFDLSNWERIAEGTVVNP